MMGFTMGRLGASRRAWVGTWGVSHALQVAMDASDLDPARVASLSLSLGGSPSGPSSCALLIGSDSSVTKSKPMVDPDHCAFTASHEHGYFRAANAFAQTRIRFRQGKSWVGERFCCADWQPATVQGSPCAAA
jgi:hypothetical protein